MPTVSKYDAARRKARLKEAARKDKVPTTEGDVSLFTDYPFEPVGGRQGKSKPAHVRSRQEQAQFEAGVRLKSRRGQERQVGEEVGLPPGKRKGKR